MNHWKKPLLANGIILAVFFLISWLFGSRELELPDHFFFMSIFMMFMAPVNLITGILRNRLKKPDGKLYIILAGLLLLVGFSACSGMVYTAFRNH